MQSKNETLENPWTPELVLEIETLTDSALLSKQEAKDCRDHLTILTHKVYAIAVLIVLLIIVGLTLWKDDWTMRAVLTVASYILGRNLWQKWEALKTAKCRLRVADDLYDDLRRSVIYRLARGFDQSPGTTDSANAHTAGSFGNLAF